MALEFEYLLQEISVGQPCGMDCSFSNEFLNINNARKQDDLLLEQGDWVADPKQADWSLVEAWSIELLNGKTKDLRLYTWLTEAWSHLYGFEGIARCLELYQRSLVKYWLQLHPAIEDGDLDQRLGLLEGFIVQLPGLIRQVSLIGQSPFYSLKDYEIFLYQHHQKRKQQSEETEEQENSAQDLLQFEQLLLNTPKPLQQQNYQYILEIQHQWQQFKTVLDGLLGSEGPGFAAADAQLEAIFVTIQRLYLKQTTSLPELTAQSFDEVQRTQNPAENPAIPSPHQMIETWQHSIQLNGQHHIVHRAQAMKVLQEIADYFQIHEPHSPVSYMLQKTIKWGQLPLHEWLVQVVKNENPLEHLHELLGVSTHNESGREW
jgi:type VI secretion system protein ImpA